MTLRSASLLDTASYSPEQIKEIFDIAERFEQIAKNDGSFQKLPSRKRVIGHLFFEPSTRTRMSFQMAATRLGYSVLDLDNASSSVAKGETLADTVLNIVAMGPDALVIRYGQDAELDHLLPKLTIPVVNAGSGTTAHPTQALLDAFTIFREKGTLNGVNVLIVGDIRHSRVARSNFDVLAKLGANVAVCGPPEFIPKEDLPAAVKVFSSLDEATRWCDVYMALRIQLERHAQSKTGGDKLLDDYHERFGLNQTRLQILKKDAMIMHPGPINHGVEFALTANANSNGAGVMTDSRNRVLRQVSNGVIIRAAVLARALGDAKTKESGE